MDVEAISYATKELARGMHEPTVGHLKNLTRLGRYLSSRMDFGIEAKLDELEARTHRIVIQADSDHAGDKWPIDGRISH